VGEPKLAEPEVASKGAPLMVGSAAEAYVGTMCGDGPEGGASAGRRPAPRGSGRPTRRQKGWFDPLGTVGTVGTMVPVGEGASRREPRLP
jgi:hypothetical protein